MLSNEILIETFKEAVSERNVERMAKLVDRFNAGMKEAGRANQLEVIKELVCLGLMENTVYDLLEGFGGTFAGYGYSHWKTALTLLEQVKTKLSPKDTLDMIAHQAKHMGLVAKDFYAVMAEARKILHLPT